MKSSQEKREDTEMDIESQLERYLNEGRDDMGGSQIGKLLYQRYKSTKDVEDKVDLLFRLNILIVGLITKDRILVTKSRSNS